MTALENSTSEIISTVAKVRATYNARVTRPLEWRRAQLKAMIAMLEENESRWSDALRQDLGKPTIEGFITDIAFVIGGAFGLGDAVRQRAARRVSLAPWILPHELARLVLVEQLYRAGTIVRGEPYHK